MEEVLIAPCGMNCALCSSYLSLKNDLRREGFKSYCDGCRPRDKQCAFLKKKCKPLQSGQVQYCYECADFPCSSLSHLDKRYRTLYRMSMIENLEFIRDKGIEQFMDKEEEKWRCPDCGETVCCHNGICFNCGVEKLKARKKWYRWEDD